MITIKNLENRLWSAAVILQNTLSPSDCINCFLEFCLSSVYLIYLR